MNKLIYSFIFFSFFFAASAQKEKIIYNDTSVTKLGLKIRITDALAVPEFVRAKMLIQNTNDFFLIVEPAKFYFLVNGVKFYCKDKGNKIPMNGKRTFGPDAKGKKMNTDLCSFVMEGIQRTNHHKTISFPEYDLTKPSKNDFSGITVTTEGNVMEKGKLKLKLIVMNNSNGIVVFNPSVIEVRDGDAPVNNSRPRTKPYLLKAGEKEWVTCEFLVASMTGEKKISWNDALVSADLSTLPAIEIVLTDDKRLLKSFTPTVPEVGEENNDQPEVAAPIMIAATPNKKDHKKDSKKDSKKEVKSEPVKQAPIKEEPMIAKAEPIKKTGASRSESDEEMAELHASEINYDDVGKFYALLIGISNYTDAGIADLDSLPVKDARALAKVLTTQYTFAPENTKTLVNPTRREIVIALDDLSKKVTPMDNVLIFYAGHGHYEDENDIGYWLPKDAELTNSANWLYNDQLVASMRKIKSLHTLLVSDACFSGSIFKNRSIALTGANDVIKKKYALPSRKALTSGTLKTVPNKSVFMKYFLDRLTTNKEKYFSSSALYQSIETPVGNNSSSLPQFGVIQNVGDEGGDFIFIKRK